MEILEAYCVEHKRPMDIFDARNAFFAQPEPRKRFLFHCSDERCRATKPPVLVVGVNYDKLAEETEVYRQLHFKSHAKHEHHPDCIWRSTGLRPPLPGDSVDESTDDGRIERAKETNLIDVFTPKAFDPQIDLSRPREVQTQPPIEGLPPEPVTAGPAHAREGYSTTTKLERLIDCWSTLSDVQRRAETVVIEGIPLTYRQAVLHVMSITPEENGTRVVQGGVRIGPWPKDNPTRFYLNFMDGCARFPEHEGSSSLTIELTLARIRKYRGGAFMLEQLRKAQQPTHYMKAYCWGSIVAREQKQGYALDIASLDNLVLKVLPRARQVQPIQA